MKKRLKPSKKLAKKKTKKVKNNLRARTKFAAFKPNLNLRTRYDEISDILTYANELPDKAKKWLAEFTEEYVGANFNHGGVIRHKTKKHKKNCYDRNNSRNRDILTRSKAQGSAVIFSQLNDKDESVNEMDRMIDELDRKKFNEEELEDTSKVVLHGVNQKKK